MAPSGSTIGVSAGRCLKKRPAVEHSIAQTPHLSPDCERGAEYQ